ncbi:hypothetical protein SAMN05428975_0323 [Mucilaginibacter sp. OK268]|uniref:hypothetical protein n=1 Tax=Mucilaginibacter sp. OK268 TaxID=1881048 RepID=UPI00088D72CC|nr:hypothetical protein [Mucilaginibacter sp. OK268]SDP10582.1 hypothetical protein SAMN05428975_0323 [Mucilaginibacter sp. OK268]
MEPYKDDKRLAKLAEDCLQDPAISRGMAEGQLSLGDIRRALLDAADKIWETATSDLLELDKLEQRIAQFETANDKYLCEPKVRYVKAYRLKLIPLFMSLVVTFVLFPIIVWLTRYLPGGEDTFRWDYSALRSWFAGLILFSVLVFFYRAFQWMVYLVIKQWNGRFLQRMTGPDGYNDYLSWQTKHADLTTLADANLRDKGVLEMIRAMINERITPSYALSLAHIEGKGLAEVIDVSQTIDSQAKQKLDFLFDNMPGGSIGIAGPRGAGKSTLIQTYCGPNRAVSQLKEKKVLATMVLAPVKYDPREFILYLFSAVCLSVLKDTDRMPADIFEDEMRRNQEQPFRSSRLWIWSYLPVLSILTGLLLLIMSVTLYRWHQELHTTIGKRQAAMADSVLKSKAQVKGKADSIQVKPTVANNLKKRLAGSDTNKVKMKAAVDTASVARPDSTTSFLGFYTYQVSKSDAAPVTLFNIALLLIGMGFIFLVFGKRDRSGIMVFFSVIRAMLRTDQVKRRREALRNRSPELPESALRWLKKLKFQQSYTTGWSGSLKLPVALEGSLSRAMTLAEKQLSNPEIIAAFTEFLVQCTADYQVIIGIDELDKMASEEDAKLFLNEIKSVFGIPRVFYLISVSENAMNSFERRGMPFRDVFDSSFDSIVYVDYLNLTATQLLLQRRIVGKPMPFFSLAFCLAGGLPRDVIRYFRNILELAVNDRQLPVIVQRLVTDEVDAKIRAMLQALRQLRQVPGAEAVLAALYGMKPGNYTTTELETAAGLLGKKLKNLAKAANAADASDEARALLALANESWSYLAYAATLLALFSLNTEVKIKQMETDGHYQELGRVRQLLAVDHGLALDLVIGLRKKTRLKALTGSRVAVSDS